MSWSAILAAAAAVLLFLLVVKLRGGGRRDLLGPPGPKVFDPSEAARIGELMARGERDEAIRLIRQAGHDEAAALRLIGLIERLSPATCDDPEERRG